MTGFDIIVLLIVAIAAVGGFMRGFVQEILSLAAWVLAILAIQQLHTPLQQFIEPRFGTPTTSAMVVISPPTISHAFPIPIQSNLIYFNNFNGKSKDF